MKVLSLLAGISLMLAACNSDYVIRPRGYYKIELPQKAYRWFDAPRYPYTFEYPVYGTVLQDSLFFEEKAENPYWINVDFPQFDGRIHISYKDVRRHDFDSLVNDAYTLSYKQHTYKASGINPQPFTTPSGIEGVYFTLKGNTATANQFFVTDTVRHFLRGALYFNATPNQDSIQPVNDFLKKDLWRLINSIRWKD